jgi:hypothetical protein
MVGDVAPLWPGSARQPLLRLHDGGYSLGTGRPPLQSWHTQLTLLSSVALENLQTVAAADVVLVQRLDATLAGLVGSALLLAPEVVTGLGELGYDMVAAFRGGATRYVWLSPTALERQTFG